MRRSTRARGWAALEATVSLAVMGLLLTGLVVARAASARSDDYLMAQQHCTAAAAAQLDSLAATGEPLADDRVAELWPKVCTRIERTPGGGTWEGLVRVRVTAVAPTRGRQARITLTRYLSAGQEATP